MSTNRFVTCPYDEAHKLKESKLQLHITKCRRNHLSEIDKMFVCPFNATHVVPMPEKDYHMKNCADKAPLDRKLSQSLYKNNPFKGNTSVPSYNESPLIITEEMWDDESTTATGSGYVPPAEPPIGAIIEPPPLSKPAERRRLYRELHRQPTEQDVRLPESPPPPPTIPKEPKQPTETSRIEMLRKQNVQNYQNLGLGRGKVPAPSRIAANFNPAADASYQLPTERSYSAAISAGISQLGLGRGQPNRQQVSLNSSIFTDDNEFPALGFGRGVTKASQNGMNASGPRR